VGSEWNPWKSFVTVRDYYETYNKLIKYLFFLFPYIIQTRDVNTEDLHCRAQNPTSASYRLCPSTSLSEHRSSNYEQTLCNIISIN
jgi:hypothetical protein